MITGLLAEVTGKELIQTALEKAKYYKELQSKINAEIKNLKDKKEKNLIDSDMLSKSQDILGSMESKLDSSMRKEQFFSFMATHINKDEVYRLSKIELENFELIPTKY